MRCFCGSRVSVCQVTHCMCTQSFFSALIRFQGSFLTCLPVCVFPAERRVKMCWRLRAWRPLACCRAGFSLEANRHCRAVSTRHSLSSPLYSILFVSFLRHPSPLSFSLSYSTLNGALLESLSEALIIFKIEEANVTDTNSSISLMM